jgi:putative DNA primase/helicase
MSAFDDWKQDADAMPLLEAAALFGAKLKRAGQEHIGPCPNCGGTDRFSISPGRSVWNCRGAHGGGGAISLAIHAGQMSFLQACELLTGRANPSGGHSRPLSAAEIAERDRRWAEYEATRRAREAQQMAREEFIKDEVQRIWRDSAPINGTLAETYLKSRGIPAFATDVLRFHPSLEYQKSGKSYPVLVCRVDDVDGALCAIWRIYLRGDGRKADVANPKLGLGPAGGGAVRIGGVGAKIGLAEGVETALGAWHLIGRQYPVWSCLSTAGLVGIELPLDVEHVVIFPDGDRPVRKQGDEFVPAVPAGRKAAEALRDDLIAKGLTVTLAAEPNAGRDYLDLWQIAAREVAA